MNKYKIFLATALLILVFSQIVLAQEYASSAEVLFSFGQAYLKENNFAEAKREFEKCLMLNPQHKQAKELFGLCEKKLMVERDEAMTLALNGVAKKIKPEIPPKPTKVKESKTLAPHPERAAWALKLKPEVWYLKQGEFYGETYNKYYWDNHKFDNKGKKKRWDYDGKYNEIRTELKLEYGIIDRLTLMFYTVAKEAHWKDSYKSCTKKGFTEVWPGVRFLLFEDPFICSLQLRVKIPLHYNEQAVPALGTHQTDEEIKILTAQRWPKLPGYTKFELGFKERNEEPTNEIVYFTQLGYNLTGNLILELTLEGVEGLAHTGEVEEDWTKGTFGPVFKVGALNLKFGYGNTFAGKNTSAAEEIVFSIYTFW